MASLITIRDNDGNIIEVPGFRGPAGKIKEVTASVDNTSGTPSVDVVLGGTEEERTIGLEFSGLKGEAGAGEVDSVNGQIGVVELTAEDVGAAPTEHEHEAGDITSGTLPVVRGGTGQTSVDSTPTSGSSKMVTSGGVYTALAGKAASIHTQAASTITAGTFPATDMKMPAGTDYTTARIRNAVLTTSDPGEGAASSYPNGTLVFVYE